MAQPGDVAYTSRVRIERLRGPMREAYLPSEEAPVARSIRDAIEIGTSYELVP